MYDRISIPKPPSYLLQFLQVHLPRNPLSQRYTTPEVSLGEVRHAVVGEKLHPPGGGLQLQ
jgi:hypothetical protein